MKTRTLVILVAVAFVITMVSAAHAQTPARMPSFTEPSVEAEHNKLFPPPERRIMVVIGGSWRFECVSPATAADCENVRQRIEDAYSAVKTPSGGKSGEMFTIATGRIYCSAIKQQCDKARKRLRTSGIILE